MKSLIQGLNYLHNWFQIISCSFILIFYALNISKIDDQKENLVLILRIIQLEQSLDIIFNLFNRGGGILSSLMQISGRNIVAFFIIDQITDNFSLSLVIVCWNLADFIRYIFYLTKNQTITYIRYSAFKILYPLGIIGECFTVENRINRKDSINHLILRVLQVIQVLGMLYLYRYLLNKSKEVLKKQNQEKIRNKDS